MKEIAQWLNQFREIREARFDEWGKVLETLKNRKNESQEQCGEKELLRFSSGCECGRHQYENGGCVYDL